METGNSVLRPPDVSPATARQLLLRLGRQVRGPKGAGERQFLSWHHMSSEAARRGRSSRMESSPGPGDDQLSLEDFPLLCS